MTDEEKAEFYDKNVLCHRYDSYGTRLFDDNDIIRAVKYGLAEGRKEATEKNFKEAYQKYVNNSLATFDMKKALENARDQIRIVKENEKLKNENEKLKQEIESWKKRAADVYWEG